MKPLMARWMLLWLEANHVSGLRSELMLAYITRDCDGIKAEEWDAPVEARAQARQIEPALHLPCISPVSALYLRYICAISALYLAYISQAREVELAEEAAAAAGGASRYAAPARGSAAHAQLRLHALLQLKLSRGELTGKAMQMLNLAEEWLST